MFDHLHMHLMTHEEPVTPECRAMREYVSGDAGRRDRNVYGSMLSCEYCIDGRTYNSPPAAVSDYAREKLYYIKAFDYMESGARYYTRRANEPSYLLLFTYEGEGTLMYEGRRRRMEAGDGVLIDCRRPHEYRTSGRGWTHADLHFDGGESRQFCDILGQKQEHAFRQPLDGEFQRKLEELIDLYEGITPYRELLISGKLSEILSLLVVSAEFYTKEVGSMPENLSYLLRYVHSFYNRHLTLDFLASFSGFSKPHLIRLFNRYLGCSPREYIIRLQMEQARRLLETTSLPAVKIGVMVGIENASYFSALFKARTGMTPGEYRRHDAEGVVSAKADPDPVCLPAGCTTA